MGGRMPILGVLDRPFYSGLGTGEYYRVGTSAQGLSQVCAKAYPNLDGRELGEGAAICIAQWIGLVDYHERGSGVRTGSVRLGQILRGSVVQQQP